MAAGTYQDTGIDAPGGRAAAITPDTDNDLATNTRAVYVGGAGNLIVHMAADAAGSPTAVTFTAVPAGTLLPIRVRRVLATGTATAIVGIW